MTPKTAPKPKKTKEKTKIGTFFEKLNGYFTANTPVLKKARKKELIKAFKAIFRKEGKESAKTNEVTEEIAEEEAKVEGETLKKTKDVEELKPEKKKKKKLDLTNFFVEIDSFIGWLLSFYIIYFFLINFSLEKNMGLKREFVFQTLKTPLILNITIFLLLIHFTLRLKNLHFQRNFLATLFLLFLSLGVYTLLIVNF